MNILEELYYGNINISERDVKEGSDEQAALSAASDAQIKLMDALPDDLKPLLNNLNAANDVLSDIIQKNGHDRISEKRAKAVKNLLKDYRTMSGTLRQALMDMGFTITEDGKHYRLTYYGDGRYKTTVSKTASDHREGKNIASTIIKNMF